LAAGGERGDRANCWRSAQRGWNSNSRKEADTYMAMDAKEIERLIKARFPGAAVAIRDLAGDGDHYAAHVVAREFAGKNRVQQHKMVYDALQGRMGGVLHALALTTAVPED
jgi:stress-induced morphogen